MKNQKTNILICFLCLFFINCASIKSEVVSNDKIDPNYKNIKNNLGLNIDWVFKKNTTIKTFLLHQNNAHFVIYTQEISNLKNNTNLVLYYLEPNNDDFELISYSYSFEKYIMNYKKLTSIHWINCRLVCQNKELKEAVLKLWDKKLPK